MLAIQERVAQVEVKVDTFRTDVADLKAMIVALDQRMERRFDAIDRRFEMVDRRFGTVEGRLFTLMGVGIASLIGILTGVLNMMGKLF